MTQDFQECALCSETDASTLCESCLNNRATIYQLRHYLCDYRASSRSLYGAAFAVGAFCGLVPFMVTLWIYFDTWVLGR